ncbi:mutator type transposase [Tanacetum coccineum]|uniref:Mutator type transposase n=1 Tax=Tanacetum coccineum TaxID=301880 RepID=A0ABQ4YQJ9_9ASTR
MMMVMCYDDGEDGGGGSGVVEVAREGDDELVDKENLVEHVHVDMDTLDKSNVDTLGVDDREGEFNANEEIDVDLDVIEIEEFESTSDAGGLERIRQRKLRPLRKQNKPKNGDVHKYYFYVGQEFVSREQLELNAGEQYLCLNQLVGPSQLTGPNNELGQVTKKSGLRSYVMELKASNLNTTVRIGVESEADHTCVTRIFKRVYICLGVAKTGFKVCMRDFLSFDGAFMKGSFPGQLLTAVGIDSNNGIYLMAYGIVELESKDSCTWFLEHLKEDLELQDNSNFTFIYDRQKGIIPAIEALFLVAEHRKLELTSMACKHVVVANWNMVANNMEVGLPETWRPLKKRKKTVREYIPMVKHGKMSRRSNNVTCVLCKSKGHNRRSCTCPRSGEATKKTTAQGGSNKTKTTQGGSNKTKSAQGGSNNKRPSDSLSGRNVVAKKTKIANPTQASQTTQASTSPAMRKNKGKAIADSSRKSRRKVRRS